MSTILQSNKQNGVPDGYESFYSKPENRELARTAMRELFDKTMLPIFELMNTNMAEAGKKFIQEVSDFSDRIPKIPLERLYGFILTAYPEKKDVIKLSIKMFFDSCGITEYFLKNDAHQGGE